MAAFRFGAVFRRPNDLEAVRRELAAAEQEPPAAPDGARPDAQQPPLPGIANDAGPGARRAAGAPAATD